MMPKYICPEYGVDARGKGVPTKLARIRKSGVTTEMCTRQRRAAEEFCRDRESFVATDFSQLFCRDKSVATGLSSCQKKKMTPKIWGVTKRAF